MSLWDIFYVFAIALTAAVLLAPWVRKICLDWRVFDLPERRKVHNKPTPTLGGLAIFFAFFIAILFALAFNREFRLELIPYLPGLILGASVVVSLGVVHDLRHIHPFVKLGGQIIAALIAFNLGLRIETLTNPFG
ncbi:undecaprenyl-phosphate alpha-N-acetylglucosaminyl 1-phosphate transferase, partial [Candidatus Omnitrophota bacterium]